MRLVLDDGAGALGTERRQEAKYDHVIAATGYRQDLARLGYVSPDVRRAVSVAGGAPYSQWFESTVPGLYFVGSSAAAGLGATRVSARAHRSPLAA